MTQEESLDTISHLSEVIGWLQFYHRLNARLLLPIEDEHVENLITGLVTIRERIRKDYEVSKENPA